MTDLLGDANTSPDGAAPDDELVDIDAEQPSAEKRKSEALSFLRELPFLIIGALIVAVLVKSFLIQVFWIPSGSMNDTLLEGDRVIVNKISYRFGDPGRGDVVVFEPATFEEESIATKISRNLLESVGLRTPESDLIKRIIGLPGETIEIRENQVLINGVPLDEPYITTAIEMSDLEPQVIPEDMYWVMGDNRRRSGSNDSRSFGPIERDRVVGRAFAVVWPPSRWSGL